MKNFCENCGQQTEEHSSLCKRCQERQDLKNGDGLTDFSEERVCHYCGEFLSDCECP